MAPGSCARALRLAILMVLVGTLFSEATLARLEEATPTSGDVSADVPMLGADPAHTSSQPGPGPGDSPVVRWVIRDLGAIGSALVLVDGMLYAGTEHGELLAVDAATGSSRWSAALPAPVQTSAVGGGMVFASSGRLLVAFDAASGRERWRLETDHVLTAPTVVDEVVYVGSWSGSLAAVDAASGTIRWQAPTDEETPLSAPAVADGLIFVGSEGGALYAFDGDTGNRRWRVATTGAPATPAVVGGVVFVGEASGAAVALEAASGTLRWRTKVASTGECCAAPAVAGGAVYFGLSTGLVALEATTGQERWRWESGGYAVGIPAVAAGDIYAGGFATFAAGSHAGFLFVVDAATGQERWRYAAGEWVSATPVVAGGAAYIGTWAGSLVCLAD